MKIKPIKVSVDGYSYWNCSFYKFEIYLKAPGGLYKSYFSVSTINENSSNNTEFQHCKLISINDL